MVLTSLLVFISYAFFNYAYIPVIAYTCQIGTGENNPFIPYDAIVTESDAQNCYENKGDVEIRI